MVIPKHILNIAMLIQSAAVGNSYISNIPMLTHFRIALTKLGINFYTIFDIDSWTFQFQYMDK